MTRIILALNALTFMGLGIACLIDPSLISNWAGYEFSSPDAWIEASAMYGGLQLAIGAFTGLGVLFQSLRPSVVVLNTMIYFGLFGGRLLGYYQAGGPEVGIFIIAALWIEAVMSLLMVVICFLELRRSK